jgi:hypothetical protein
LRRANIASRLSQSIRHAAVSFLKMTDDPRIESITFLSAGGKELPDSHYRTQKNTATTYQLNHAEAPASIRINYFDDAKPREISFSFTTGIGL